MNLEIKKIKDGKLEWEMRMGTEIYPTPASMSYFFSSLFIIFFFSVSSREDE